MRAQGNSTPADPCDRCHKIQQPNDCKAKAGAKKATSCVPCQLARKRCSWSGGKNADSDAAPTIKRRRADPASPKAAGSKKRARKGGMTDVSGASTRDEDGDDEEEEEDEEEQGLVPMTLDEAAADNRDGIGMLVEIGISLREMWREMEDGRVRAERRTSGAIAEMAEAMKVIAQSQVRLAESQEVIARALDAYATMDFVQGSSRDGAEGLRRAAEAAEKRQQLEKVKAEEVEKAKEAEKAEKADDVEGHKETVEEQGNGKGKEKEVEEEEEEEVPAGDVHMDELASA